MPKPFTVEEAMRESRELLASGDLSAALIPLAAILKLIPDYAPALHLLALINYRNGDLPKAISTLRLALRSSPKSAEIHNDLGNLLQMSGAVEEAVAAYQKALRLRPDYAEAHRNLASAFRRLGRLDEAVTALETAVSLNPGFAEALAQLVHQLKQRCEWSRIESLTASLIQAVVTNSAPVNPFVFLSLDTTAAQQLQCARRWSAAHFP